MADVANATENQIDVDVVESGEGLKLHHLWLVLGEEGVKELATNFYDSVYGNLLLS